MWPHSSRKEESSDFTVSSLTSTATWLVRSLPGDAVHWAAIYPIWPHLSSGLHLAMESMHITSPQTLQPCAAPCPSKPVFFHQDTHTSVCLPGTETLLCIFPSQVQSQTTLSSLSCNWGWGGGHLIKFQVRCASKLCIPFTRQAPEVSCGFSSLLAYFDLSTERIQQRTRSKGAPKPLNRRV